MGEKGGNASYRGELSRAGETGVVSVLILSHHLLEEDVAVFPGDFEGAALVGVGAAPAVFAVGLDRGADPAGTDPEKSGCLLREN